MVPEKGGGIQEVPHSTPSTLDFSQVFALLNGAELDHGEGKAVCFDGQCPDGGRVKVHGELIQ